MKITDVKNKKDFKKYIHDYGTHVIHIIGEYYGIRKVNMDWDLYEVRKYREKYSSHYYNDLDFVKEVHSEECVSLIIKEVRRMKLEKLNGVGNRL